MLCSDCRQRNTIMPPEPNERPNLPDYFDAEFRILFASLGAVALASFAFTDNRVNWLLDAIWVAAGLPLIFISRRWFPLSPLLYRLLVFHALVLIAGGYWTYEKMPLGVWLQELSGSERNHFDRFGHFMQGFVPAIIFREVFLRCSPVGRGGWLIYFVLSSCLAFSALFELIEWWATLLSGGNADSFLGHQGDIWDAQWDMLWAVAGAVAALCLLSWPHDRSLNRLLRSLQ
jgi:putative membrane protein